MRILEFVWPRHQIDHIAEHGVTVDEFEEVCKAKSLFIRVPSEGENPVYNVYGQTRAGRHLFCVVIRLADGKGYAISARPMTEKETRLEKPMKKMRIPKTDSIKELAHFFETHDMGDFESELAEIHEVTGPIAIPRNSILVHLEPRQAAEVKKLAKAEGISEEVLVHRWILRHLAGMNGRASGHRKRTVRGGKS
jgi:uncharacterized DUF497 family protein